MSDLIPFRMFFLCSGELVNEKKIHQFTQAHIVGELRLRFSRDINRSISFLAYYNTSLPTTEVPLIFPFIGVYVPYSPRICCTLCDRVAKWEINQSTFDALMAHLSMSAAEEG